jgi:hypothetical protein
MHFYVLYVCNFIFVIIFIQNFDTAFNANSSEKEIINKFLIYFLKYHFIKLKFCLLILYVIK